MDRILLIGFLFFWFFPSALIGHTAMSRGRSPMFWLAASLVVSPVAGLVALLISGKSREVRADEYTKRIEAEAAEYLDLQEAVRRERFYRLTNW